MFLSSPLRVVASAALLSLTFAASTASAAGVVGITDTFGNNNFNGWTTSPTDNSGSSQGNVSTFNLGGSHGYVVWMEGQCCGGSSPDAYISKVFTTAGYNSLTLSFDWEGYSTDWANPANQFLYVQWRANGVGNWTTLNTYNLYPANGFDSESLSLFTNLANPYSTVEIRFYTNVNDNNDSAKLDNILLSGQQNAPDPTPIPGALPLFMSGAAVFGGLVYRRKRKQPAA
jgi:hypothetical protein